MLLQMMLLFAEYSAIVNLNGFEKAKVRWQKYFKIMVKLAQTTMRNTGLSIAYSPCYSIVLMCYNWEFTNVLKRIIIMGDKSLKYTIYET